MGSELFGGGRESEVLIVSGGRCAAGGGWRLAIGIGTAVVGMFGCSNREGC